MNDKKEIVVLSGAGHKGIVKYQNVTGKNTVKGCCNLDFRPSNAKLYLVGDKIAEITLYDINTAFEVPFCANDDVACVVRSSALIMFGGRGAKCKTLAKIDEYNKQKAVQKTLKNSVETLCENVANECEISRENMPISSKESMQNKGEKQAKIDGKSHAFSLANEWTKYDGNNFYYAVKPQLDELFVCHPRESALDDAVDNSKWVRVETNDGYYVVGVLFNEDEPSFICYGVPSKDKTSPPDELENACVWLPLPDGKSGYWVIYQSARNGSIVK